jgi:hypothetical protein
MLTALQTEIEQSLLNSVLTSRASAAFVLSICDDPSDGPFLFTFAEYADPALLLEVIAKCAAFSQSDRGFANYVVSQSDQNYRMILQSSKESVRRPFARLVCQVMSNADAAVVDGFLDFVVLKLPSSLRFWQNYDDIFLVFPKSSPKYLPAFLNFLDKVIPSFKDPAVVYSRINLSALFEVISSLVTPFDTHKSFFSSPNFFSRWLVSPHHSAVAARILQSSPTPDPSVFNEYLLRVRRSAAKSLIRSRSLCCCCWPASTFLSQFLIAVTKRVTPTTRRRYAARGIARCPALGQGPRAPRRSPGAHAVCFREFRAAHVSPARPPGQGGRRLHQV